MADNNQGFWSYLWNDFKDTFSPKRVIEKTANVIAWKPIDYKEPKSTAPITLNDVAMTDAHTTSNSVQNPDLTAPKNNLWTNSIGWQTDIDLTSWPTLAEVAQNSQTYSHQSVADSLELQAKDKITEQEKLITDEKEWNFLQRTWKTISNFWNSIRDAATDQLTNKLVDMEKQKNERYAAVGYNEDNWDIIRLAINEGQWYTDDFHDTLFSVWEWNSSIFSQLYDEYQQNDAIIDASWLDDYSKAELKNENRQNFKDEVEKRNLLKLYSDDYYSNQKWWFYPNMVAANRLSWKWFKEWLDVIDRRKDQFSKEELDTLAKTGIKSADDDRKLSDTMFDAFLEAYEANNKTEEIASIWTSDTAKVRYTINDEMLAEMRSNEAHQIYDWVWSQLTTLVDNWTISEDEANDILQNSYSWVADYLLDQMHLYMDPSLAYYTAVKNKNPGDMTDGERAILWYGPWMFKLMDDMTQAIGLWLTKSIEQGINDWKLSTTLEEVNWLSINDFFKDAIKDSNIQAWWIDLSARDSAVDAMQWINQNIAYLYWKDKGSWLRQAKTEAGKWLWAYWWIWWELAQDLTVWALRLFWADKLADYTLADATKLMNLETDPSMLWNKNWGRLLKKYWLEALENVPEFYWVYKSFAPLTRVGRAWWSYWVLRRINSIKNWVKRTKELQKYYQTIKKWIGTVSEAGWGRNRLSKMTSAMSDKLWPVGNAVIKKWGDALKRVASDQAIDMMASYYDTENYSTPSYLLSVWLTWAFELFPALFKDTELLKIIRNKVAWRWALDWTWWRLMDEVMSNDKLMQRWTNVYWLDYDTFRQLAKQWAWNSLDEILRASYLALDEWWKSAVRQFSKQEAINQINAIMDIDWQSSYWRNLARILSNNQTNWLDLWKYVLWIPWKVEYGWLQSSIVFKEWKDVQTRVLLSEYDTQLDKIDGQFRRKLTAWFTDDDIKQIADRTKYKDVLDKWAVNKKYFVKDGWKYYLNSDGAGYLKLRVSDYTDAMRKADVLRAQAEWVENDITEMLSKLSEWRWISPDTVRGLATSWAYKNIVDAFSVFC